MRGGADLPDEAFDLLRSGKTQLFAAPREVLMEYAATLPGSRVMEGAYGVNNIGVAITKGTASMRKPETPSWIQKPMILRISACTSGFEVLRSGWKS